MRVGFLSSWKIEVGGQPIHIVVGSTRTNTGIDAVRLIYRLTMALSHEVGRAYEGPDSARFKKGFQNVGQVRISTLGLWSIQPQIEGSFDMKSWLWKTCWLLGLIPRHGRILPCILRIDLGIFVGFSRMGISRVKVEPWETGRKVV